MGFWVLCSIVAEILLGFNFLMIILIGAGIGGIVGIVLCAIIGFTPELATGLSIGGEVVGAITVAIAESIYKKNKAHEEERLAKEQLQDQEQFDRERWEASMGKQIDDIFK